MSVGAGHALPILDLRDLDADDDASARFRRTLRDVLHDVGFLSLIGHGIPDDVTAGAFAEAARFFALPAEDKASVEMLRSPRSARCSPTGSVAARSSPAA